MSAPSLEEKVAQVEAGAFLVAPLRPDTQVVQRPGWIQITTPSARQPWLNGIILSVMGPSEVDARISEVLAHYGQWATPFRWCVSPQTRPLDLSQRLIGQGFVRTADSVGMWAEVQCVSLSPVPGITVERVTTNNVGDYVAAFLAGWQISASSRSEFEGDVLRELSGSSLSYYVAHLGGRPVGTATLKHLPHSGYLMGTSVVPEARGRGVYKALVSARLNVLKSEGVPVATLEANRQTSAPLCERWGFEPVCPTSRYEWRPSGESLRGSR